MSLSPPRRPEPRGGPAPAAPPAAEAGALGDAGRIARLYGEMWSRFRPPRRPLPGAAVTPRMLALLRHLEWAGPLTVGEQAVHLEISRATASELVDRLETRGLVQRMRDGRDRRRVFVWLTDAGHEQIRALAGHRLDEPFVRAVGALTPATRAAIITGLEALLRADEETRSSVVEETS